MTLQDALNSLSAKVSSRLAGLMVRFYNKTASAYQIEIDLSTAIEANNAKELPVNMKCFAISKSSSPDAEISFILDNVAANGTVVPNKITLRAGDCYVAKPGVSKLRYFHSAQSGQSLTILMSEFDVILPGVSRSVSDGGVAPSGGSNLTRTVTTLAAATAAIIVPARSTRVSAVIQNNTGNTLYIGESNAVAATTSFISYAAGAYIPYDSKAALWGFSTPGGVVTVLEQLV